MAHPPAIVVRHVFGEWDAVEEVDKELQKAGVCSDAINAEAAVGVDVDRQRGRKRDGGDFLTRCPQLLGVRGDDEPVAEYLLGLCYGGK